LLAENRPLIRPATSVSGNQRSLAIILRANRRRFHHLAMAAPALRPDAVNFLPRKLLARISHHVEMIRAGAVENAICEAGF
jgi:hypothetical protein